MMVVDISRSVRARSSSGRPFDAKPGESTRELRVWRSHHVLIVLNTNCGVGPGAASLHAAVDQQLPLLRHRGTRTRRSPKLLSEFEVDTHEFFLWEDPKNPDRALIFAGNAASTCGDPRRRAQLPVLGLGHLEGAQRAAAGDPLQRAATPTRRCPPAPEPAQKPTGGLHSLTISNDGSRAYFALLTGGFAVVDVSDFAAGAPFPQPHPITDNAARPTWPGPGAHSAVKLWGRDWAWVSDEVYGTATAPDHGCPWGWTRMIDISDPKAPTVEGEYRRPRTTRPRAPSGTRRGRRTRRTTRR